MRRSLVPWLIAAVLAALFSRPSLSAACSTIPVDPWFLAEVHINPAGLPPALGVPAGQDAVPSVTMTTPLHSPLVLYDTPLPPGGHPPQPVFQLQHTSWFMWDVSSWNGPAWYGLPPEEVSSLLRQRLFVGAPDPTGPATRMVRPADAAAPSPLTRSIPWSYDGQTGTVELTLSYRLNPAYQAASFEFYSRSVIACKRWGLEPTMRSMAQRNVSIPLRQMTTRSSVSNAPGRLPAALRLAAG